MHPQDLAKKYDAKVFDSTQAAETAGYTLGQSMQPRNAWNRDSAAQAIFYDLLRRKQRGEVSEIGLVLDGNAVTGAFK
ncbi:MAG TPA: hypothetical protein VM864_15965 [Pyrinomonadaceae bacterium]|jgi:hypothetical protein|nr:hypothetical protein [Pyrinomonadaceae bacterium]